MNAIPLLRRFYLWLIFANPFFLTAQPVINAIFASDSIVEQYNKFEVTLDLTATYTNVYDYDDIRVYCELTAPDGKQITVDGFFMEDYVLNESGSLTPDGEGFKVRFAPDQLGKWDYLIFVKDGTGTTSSAPLSFQCVAKTSEKNQGFVRTNQSNYLQFDEGEQYISIGENMCWQNTNPYLDYKKWLDKLSANGGNYFRLWHAHWGLGIEWKNNWSNFKGLGKYKETNGRYQDWLFDYCAENGIYVMLCLQHHGQVSTNVNPNWDDNPYNVDNGGPCAQTWDFFTDSTAIALTKNRFRYVLARWGHARSIMAWELWNEVEWTDDYENHKVEIMEWHVEMAEYIKAIDPYSHLVTTSFAHDKNDPLVWANPDMDFTQTHFYINTGNIERVLVSGVKKYLNDYQKPTLTGEFGIGLSSSLGSVDPDGIHIHNGLWGSLFGGGMGTGMTWWWDIYIEVENLYYHFKPISKIVQQMPFLEKEMSPTTVSVKGSSGDLSITPTLGWGAIGQDSITVDSDGTLTPSDPDLGSYLYGSQWNTQYRSPPVFTTTFPDAGSFSVSTSSSSSNSNPKIAIFVDGTKVLEENAEINKTYSVNVSAGTHVIKVDNTGTDWITIEAYKFSGLGSAIDAYVVKAADETVAAGWVMSNAYNHQNIGANGLPDPVSGAEVIISGFEPGTYFAKWYDCLSGEIVAGNQILVTNDTVRLAVPELLWDMAFIIDDQFVNVGIDELVEERIAKIYPNPANSGSEVTIEFEGLPASKTVQIDMIDMNGRQIQSVEKRGGTNQLNVQLSSQMATGMYWMRITEDDGFKVLPVLVR